MDGCITGVHGEFAGDSLVGIGWIKTVQAEPASIQDPTDGNKKENDDKGQKQQDESQSNVPKTPATATGTEDQKVLSQQTPNT